MQQINIEHKSKIELCDQLLRDHFKQTEYQIMGSEKEQKKQRQQAMQSHTYDIYDEIKQEIASYYR